LKINASKNIELRYPEDKTKPTTNQAAFLMTVNSKVANRITEIRALINVDVHQFRYFFQTCQYGMIQT